MEFSARSSSENGMNVVSDGLHNYHVHELVGEGSTYSVHRASCRRGRLRNRAVAVKMITKRHADDDEATRLVCSTALHQSLHHPCIVSLLSSFNTPSASFHILEYCPGGNLSAYILPRTPSVLTEAELRGVARSLVDALVYLRKERVLHRDIKPSNVLLTRDGRIKLSDFRLAIRLSESDVMTSPFRGSLGYVAPEVTSRLPYGFPADIWSLGCLLVTCLSGTPASEASSVEQVVERVTSGTYHLSDSVSFEAKDLISGLLQVNPAHRLPLHRIPSHPFFNPQSPAELLTPSPHNMNSTRQSPSKITSLPHISIKPRYPASLSKAAEYAVNKPLRPLRKFPVRSYSANSGLPPSSRINSSIRHNLQEELRETLKQQSRRIASAPVPGSLRISSILSGLNLALPTPALTDDLHSSCSTRTVPSEPLDHVTGFQEPLGQLRYPLLSKPDSYVLSGGLPPNALRSGRDLDRKASPKASIPLLSRDASSPTQDVAHVLGVEQRLSPPVSAVLRDTNPPELFSSSYLTCQTHKVAQGQLVILPSRSALVDFREGERRKGDKGNEVLVISSDGSKVEVYSAPHLSTPCCLTEPIATYTREELPAAYCTRYRDACNIADRLRRNVPYLTLHYPEARCTLMANMPQGDIEVVLPPPEPQTKHGKRTQSSPHGRYVLLRYLRRRHTIEITRHLPLQPGERKSYGEQSKKVFTTTGDNLLDGDNARKLDADEKTCLQYVLRFLRICETLEASKPGHLDLTPLVAPETAFEPNRLLTDTDTRPRDGRSRLGELLNRLDSNTTEKCPTLPNFDDKENPAVFSVPSRTNSTVIPSLNLAPRPSKFATGSTRQVTMTMAPASTSRSQRPTAGADSVPRTRTDLYETKYHPAVGWCTRLISAGEETYRIMFLDGVSLEVNIGRHSATLVTQSGEIVKSTLNEDMDTPLTIRMKSFNVFVRLFSANDKGA